MLLRSIFLVIDVGYGANGDAKDAVCRGRNPSSLQLVIRSREIEERWRVVVPGANNKRNTVFLLQIVELQSEGGEFVERAYGVRAKGEVPDLVAIGVLLDRKSTR